MAIKVSHNKKLFWIMIFFIILLIIFVFLIVKTNKDSKNNINVNKECSTNGDCVPECSCHPDSCAPLSKRGECERLICTQECSGPLDCGAGRCGCVNGKCAVVGN